MEGTSTVGLSRTLRIAGGALLASAALAAGLLLPPTAQAAKGAQPTSGARTGASGTAPAKRSTAFTGRPATDDNRGTRPPAAPGTVSGDRKGTRPDRGGSRPGTKTGPAAGGGPRAAESMAGSTGIVMGPAAAAGPGIISAGNGCARSVNVVAHQDDDLLFINPAVSNDIAAGRCVVTVFLTAGDAGRRAGYWLARERGAMTAYAAMAHTTDPWVADTVAVEGHLINRASLPGHGIELLFLRLPDGHGNPARPNQSLLQLWRGQIPSMTALGSSDTYSLGGLIGTLTAVMEAVQPDEIRTLDYHGRYGDGDHSDHHTAGYLTYDAQRLYVSAHSVTGYMGYPVADQPVNLTLNAQDEKLGYFLAYAPFDAKVCQSADACMSNFYAPRFTHSVPTAGSYATGPAPHRTDNAF